LVRLVRPEPSAFMVACIGNFATIGFASSLGGHFTAPLGSWLTVYAHLVTRATGGHPATLILAVI